MEKYKILSETLLKSQKVISCDRGDEQEAYTLSHAFLDLEESFKLFNNELLPKLLNKDITSDEIEDILHEIGEEFRHIIYHIKDSKYYTYLQE